MADFAAPLIVLKGRVKPEWLDYNGHMNVAYYTMAFDKGLDEVFDMLGIGADYVAEQKASCFAVEHHTRYIAEMREGDPFSVQCQLLSYDEKRIHCFSTIHQTADNYLAASSEQMNLHVDMNKRRAQPFPAAVLPRLTALLKAHKTMSAPENAGRAINLLKHR